MHYLNSPAEILRKLGKRAGDRRRALGLRQADLAERSGVSRPTIARFERSGDASLSHVLLLAIALGTEDEFTKLFPLPDRRTLADVVASQTLPQRVRIREQRGS